MAGLANGSVGGLEKRAGRPKRDFDNPQVVEILEWLGSGLGRVMVCRKLGLGYKTFQRMMRERADFASAVREAERARVEGCEAAIYRMATLGYESPVVLRAALAYLGRRDKIDEARRARREAARKAEIEQDS